MSEQPSQLAQPVLVMPFRSHPVPALALLFPAPALLVPALGSLRQMVES